MKCDCPNSPLCAHVHSSACTGCSHVHTAACSPCAHRHSEECRTCTHTHSSPCSTCKESVDRWPTLFSAKEQDTVQKGEAVDALLQSFDILPKKYSSGWTGGKPTLKAGYSHFDETVEAIYEKASVDKRATVNTFASNLGIVLRNIIFDEHEKSPKPLRGFEDSYVQRTAKFANAFWILYVEWVNSPAQNYLAILQEAFKRRYQADKSKWLNYYALAILLLRMDGRELTDTLVMVEGALPTDGLFSRLGKKPAVDSDYVQVELYNMLDVFDVAPSEWAEKPLGMKKGYSRFAQTQEAIFAASKEQRMLIESFALELGTVFTDVLIASLKEYTPAFLPRKGFENEYVQNTTLFVAHFKRLRRAWREMGSLRFGASLTYLINKRFQARRDDLYYPYCALAILFSRMGGSEVSNKFPYRAEGY